MTFDELQQLAEKDLKIDNLQLDIEHPLKIPFKIFLVLLKLSLPTAM